MSVCMYTSGSQILFPLVKAQWSVTILRCVHIKIAPAYTLHIYTALQTYECMYTHNQFNERCLYAYVNEWVATTVIWQLEGDISSGVSLRGVDGELSKTHDKYSDQSVATKKFYGKKFEKNKVIFRIYSVYNECVEWVNGFASKNFLIALFATCSFIKQTHFSRASPLATIHCK